MVYRGHVQNGMVVVEGSPDLPEGAEVRVELVSREEKGETLGQWLLQFSGMLTDLPSDLARNHDHYLYGVPKK